jgi:hypothetical protein
MLFELDEEENGFFLMSLHYGEQQKQHLERQKMFLIVVYLVEHLNEN